MSYIFKLSTLFTLVFVIPGIKQDKSSSLYFDKSVLYAAMAGRDIAEVDGVLAGLKESSLMEKTAYEGALLMKKAGLVSKVKDKLSFFKSGRSKLEEAIKNDEGNVEYHFLRLIIQENAPKIVRYKGDLKNDSELVRASFKKLAPVVQQAVKDYSKKSTFLKPTDF
jgi:hypothetical protein